MSGKHITPAMSSSKNAHLAILLENKREYTEALSDVLVDSMIAELNTMYTEAAKTPTAMRDGILKAFQEECEKVPKWNAEQVSQLYRRVIEKSQCGHIADLIKATLVTNVQCFMALEDDKFKGKVSVRIPNSDHFIHKCMIYLARAIWKRPYLLYHQVRSIERQRNIVICEDMAKTAIEKVVRAMIPIDLIVSQRHITTEINNEDDSVKESSESEQEEEEESQQDDEEEQQEDDDAESVSSDSDEESLIEEPVEHTSVFENKEIPREQSILAVPDVSTEEPTPALPDVSGEEPTLAIPDISTEEPTLALPASTEDPTLALPQTSEDLSHPSVQNERSEVEIDYDSDTDDDGIPLAAFTDDDIISTNSASPAPCKGGFSTTTASETDTRSFTIYDEATPPPAEVEPMHFEGGKEVIVDTTKSTMHDEEVEVAKSQRVTGNDVDIQLEYVNPSGSLVDSTTMIMNQKRIHVPKGKLYIPSRQRGGAAKDAFF